MSSQNISSETKGQMFIIGSIIVVVVLILIKTSIDISDVLEKKKFLETGLEKIEFSNIRNEIPKASFNAVNYSRNMTNTTNSFIDFVENKLSERTVQFDGAAVSSEYNNLTASTDTRLNVTVFNFFEVELIRAIFNLSTNYNLPQNFSNIPSGETRTANFTLNLASSRNLSLWIFYETSTEKIVANVTIPAEIGKSKFVGYFDLRMASERGTIRDKFFETVDVN